MTKYLNLHETTYIIYKQNANIKCYKHCHSEYSLAPSCHSIAIDFADNCVQKQSNFINTRFHIKNTQHVLTFSRNCSFV